MKAYADLYNLPEDERIAVIGKTAEHGERVGFVVEDDVKADRYINKLTSKFNVEIASRGVGPVADTILIVVRRKTDA